MAADDGSGEAVDKTKEHLSGRAARLWAWCRERADNVPRIARWEVTKNTGGADRKTVAVALLALIGIAVLVPLAAGHGVALDEGIYRVGVTEESPLYEPVAADSTFTVQEPRPSAVRPGGEQDLLVRGAQVRRIADSQKGRAAASELRATVESYNDAVMDGEGNVSAAFPVVVNLTYVEQDASRALAVGDTDEETLGSDSGDGGTDGGTDGGDGTSSGDGTGSGDGAGGDSDGGTGGDDTDGSDGADSPATNGGGTSLTERLTGGSGSGAPSDISPPFPFRSLVLAFVFVLPLNFVIQAYGSTILGERLNRRGELLLVSPVSRLDIVAGKTLPYFAGAMAVATLITVALQGSHVSVLAVAPLALLFLSATFLGAMFARSFKELTFVTVTITVSLTTYAFVPAIFTDVTPIALISPLTLIVRDLQGQAIGLGQFAFSTLPPTLTATVLFGLGLGLYREEDMFTQRPIPLKVLDALAAPLKRRRSVALVTAVLLPFVLVAELVVVALLFALGEASIPFILVAVAVIEELAKSLHVYAGYEHARYDRRVKTALILGFFSGLGFFVAEKFALIAQLVDLPDVPAGRAALESQATLGTGLPLPVVLVGLLFAPLVLHVVTASISSLGASRGKRAYVVALAVAVVVHLAYNLTVVSLYV
jgi:ABC-type Na+ efflux pump permease subunit